MGHSSQTRGHRRITRSDRTAEARAGRRRVIRPSVEGTLPFLPRKVGLVTGRGSAAERDVLAVAHDRWPAVQFEVINTAVQGANAVPEVMAALQKLEANPDVDVIIVARGGGSVEDLLPFRRRH